MTHPLFSSKCLELASAGSDIREIFLLGQELRKTMSNLVDLSLGNPDLEPPKKVLEAMGQAIDGKLPGGHRYMDNMGYPHVRQFLAEELTKSEGVTIGADNVFLTCGAAGALQILFRSLLDAGDEVIILAPFFVEYVPYLKNIGAAPIIVQTNEQHAIDASAIQKAITPKTRMVLVNSPNNPSGVVYSAQEYNELAQVLNAAKTPRPIHLVSDEPYVNLVFNGTPVPPVLAHYSHSWIIRSHSKDLGLAGERIGFIAWGENSGVSTPETAGVLRNAARSTGFVNAPALMQRILPAAYNCRVPISVYEERVELFAKGLQEIGLDCVKPGGSFFMFPKCPVANDRDFCRQLAQKGLLTVPGSGFGKPGYFRVSLTQDLPQLKLALDILGQFVKSLHKQPTSQPLGADI